MCKSDIVITMISTLLCEEFGGHEVIFALGATEIGCIPTPVASFTSGGNKQKGSR
jgi:hypothetical protein